MRNALLLCLGSLLIASALASPLEASIRLNEVLPAPRSDWNGDFGFDIRDDEWIEIVNTGDVPLDLSDYLLLNGSGRLPVYGFEGMLEAGSYLLIYGTDAVEWQVANNAAVVGLSLNNSGDAVLLVQISGSDTLTVDSLIYEASDVGYDVSIGRNPDGHGTWEVFDHFDPTGGNGLDPTPGISNLADPPPHIFEIRRDPLCPTSSDSTHISVDAGDFSGISRVLLAYDINLEDGEEPEMELIAGDPDLGTWTYTILPCNAGDTVHYRVSVYDLTSGTISPWMGYRVRQSTVGLRLNEILADPPPDLSGDANRDGVRDAADDEFIEIVNCGSEPVDISGWMLRDASGVRHVFGDTAIVVAPGEYVTVFGGGEPTGFAGKVFVASSGALGLTNSGDTVTLLDGDGSIIDVHTYGSEGSSDEAMIRFPDCLGGWTLPSEVGLEEPFSPNSPNATSSGLNSSTWGTIKVLFR